MSVDQIKTGMKGIAFTVFEGTKPEPMDVEVLGVLRNMSGPKGDVILVRLGGKKAEYTGVVAGMSGSPVYIDGKLIGALAYRIGEFSKEPIGGVTPIASMLEINEIDNTPAPDPQVASSAPSVPVRTSVGGGSQVAGLQNYLKPIEAPLVFTGFAEDTIRRFSNQFAAAGVTPVMGSGSVSDTPQPEALETGSAAT
jgi:hypothetical protein